MSNNDDDIVTVKEVYNYLKDKVIEYRKSGLYTDINYLQHYYNGCKQALINLYKDLIEDKYVEESVDEMLINNSPTKIKRTDDELSLIMAWCDKHDLKYYIDDEIVCINVYSKDAWNKNNHNLFREKFNLILTEVDCLRMKTKNQTKTHCEFRYAFKHPDDLINDLYELEYPL